MVVQAIFVLGSFLTTFTIALDLSIYLLQRFQINHALLETVRLHTRQHMNPELFAADLKVQLQKIKVPQPLGWPNSWFAEQLSLNEQDFNLFEDSLLKKTISTPYLVINNHHQQGQHQWLLRKKGQDSSYLFRQHQTIFKANTLHLRFYYAYRPYHPILRFLARKLTNQAKHNFNHLLFKQGMLPMIIEIKHPFASHPIAWPNQSHIPYRRMKGHRSSLPKDDMPKTNEPIEEKPQKGNNAPYSEENNISNPQVNLPWPPIVQEQARPLTPGPSENSLAKPGTEEPDSLPCDHPACCLFS